MSVLFIIFAENFYTIFSSRACVCSKSFLTTFFHSHNILMRLRLLHLASSILSDGKWMIKPNNNFLSLHIFLLFTRSDVKNYIHIFMLSHSWLLGCTCTYINTTRTLLAFFTSSSIVIGDFAFASAHRKYCDFYWNMYDFISRRLYNWRNLFDCHISREWIFINKKGSLHWIWSILVNIN